jgi:hypothetical protein
LFKPPGTRVLKRTEPCHLYGIDVFEASWFSPPDILKRRRVLWWRCWLQTIPPTQKLGFAISASSTAANFAKHQASSAATPYRFKN